MATTVKTDLPEIRKRYPPLAGFWAEARKKQQNQQNQNIGSETHQVTNNL